MKRQSTVEDFSTSPRLDFLSHAASSSTAPSCFNGSQVRTGIRSPKATPLPPVPVQRLRPTAHGPRARTSSATLLPAALCTRPKRPRTAKDVARPTASVPCAGASPGSVPRDGGARASRARAIGLRAGVRSDPDPAPQPLLLTKNHQK